ncbi:permease prefix domain 1-containing protein [Raineyella sp. W15-4]|uniref:permease prefix domain 1-containing protein n=1 Tax=Raineyella sp. W15-4 TaxID=3081651 RepID=UPI002952C762|nr:permease prefix domain 1-containing protein [Raineyella sp. W15-4]WOQ17874.1 permease prefix domain 1-containing protein [Raineyella sp. W15-4]
MSPVRHDPDPLRGVPDLAAGSAGDARSGADPAAVPAVPAVPAAELGEWRSLMTARAGMTPDDVAELEDHLLAEAHDLRASGLSPEEAFLIAVRRLGAQDEVAREYGQVHSERLWRQLVLAPTPDAMRRPREHGASGSGPHVTGVDAVSDLGAVGDASRADALRDLALALGLGALAGLAVRLPAQFLHTGVDVFYPRNLSLLVLPFLVAYFLARPGGRDRTGTAVVVGAFAVSATAVNLLPFSPTGDTLFLTALHLPLALVVIVGFAHLGRRWRRLEAWMDWVRFLGELAVYYALVALGGAVVVGLLVSIFTAIDVAPDVVTTVTWWVVPMCAAGAVLVCAWLVERKRSVMENMAPVLTAVFTPVLTIALLGFLIVVAITGSPVGLHREVLIAFDALLVVVAAVVLFTVSARRPDQPARTLDWMQLVLVVAAIIADLLMLWAMSGRLIEYGASPNKLASLGANLLLLVHLGGTAWHYGRLLAGRRPSLVLERWQCGVLPVFAVWAAVVAFVFPPVFGYR